MAIEFAGQFEQLPQAGDQTGKSNLIEALITLFRDIDLDRDIAFD